jgi:maleylacetoacetate isomerase
MAAKLRLHTRFRNSAGQRVRIVLNLKGLDYEYIAIPSLTDAAYRAINPQGLMPTLEIDGRLVTQSMAIMELLEEIYPAPSIYPEDPVLGAQARAFGLVIAADLHPVVVGRVRRYLADEMGATEPRSDAWYHHWMDQGFATLEAQLTRRTASFRYCFSDEPGVAEACLVPQLANARRDGCDLSDYPTLVAIDGACRELEPFIRAAPEAQPDFPG